MVFLFIFGSGSIVTYKELHSLNDDGKDLRTEVTKELEIRLWIVLPKDPGRTSIKWDTWIYFFSFSLFPFFLFLFFPFYFTSFLLSFFVFSFPLLSTPYRFYSTRGKSVYSKVNLKVTFKVFLLSVIGL